MRSPRPRGEPALQWRRKLLSAADILGVAQANGFTRVMLGPPPALEPASLLLALAGATILAVGKRRSVWRAGDEQ